MLIQCVSAVGPHKGLICQGNLAVGHTVPIESQPYVSPFYIKITIPFPLIYSTYFIAWCSLTSCNLSGQLLSNFIAYPPPPPPQHIIVAAKGLLAASMQRSMQKKLKHKKSVKLANNEEDWTFDLSQKKQNLHATNTHSMACVTFLEEKKCVLSLVFHP